MTDRRSSAPDAPQPLASLVHGRRVVTLHSEASSTAAPVARRASDDVPADALRTAMRSVLGDRAEDLAARWIEQSRVVLRLDQHEGQEAEHAVDGRGLVDALLSAFGDDAASEDVVGYGMRFGASAFGRGVSLYHVTKALDLLAAMTLYAMESALERMDTPPVSAVDGLRLARQLQRRSALLSLATTRGYMQVYAETLRERFRHLRHDLRNPLGTIKSVLALMDDDSVPLEARLNPSFRAMATRNARSLEELIAERLSDVTALLPIVAGQDVSVRAVACAVRRELRAEADRRGVGIQVDEGGPHGRLDAAGLELLLRGALRAALQECETADQLRIGFEAPSGRALVVVSWASGRQPIQDEAALERLRTLARQIGATITASNRLELSVQLRSADGAPLAERERSVPLESAELGDGDARHDLRSSREGHHGQAGAH